MKTITLVFAMIFFVGLTIGRAQNTWTQKADFGGTARDGAVGFSIATKGYIGTGSYSKDFWEYDSATDTWTQKADFGGSSRSHSVGFSIGTKGYIGTGLDLNFNNQNDFWEYDPTTNTWTQKANFGGTIRTGAVGFSIGSNGYLGTGFNYPNFYNDFWEYDPDVNAWTQKASFGGTARYGVVGFSIGNKGYIGAGYATDGLKNDFWEYDPASNGWTQKDNFGGTPRDGAVGFFIGSKGYIGAGNGSSGLKKDFWEYSPDACNGLLVYADDDGDDYGDIANSLFVSDCIVPIGYVTVSTDCNDEDASINPDAMEIENGIDDDCSGTIDDNLWTQKALFGGTGREGAVGFSIGSKGYIGTGYATDGFKKDFWEYDPATDTWTQKADFGGIERTGAVGFSIGSKGYIGIGAGVFLATFLKDFWEYDPANNTWTQKADFGGTARGWGIGFSIDTKGYIGTGYAFGFFYDTYYQDFWEYDPEIDTWVQKANFGGGVRGEATGFSIGDKGYVGTGHYFDDNFVEDYYYNDFWQYDPNLNTWTQKANFGGVETFRAVGFSIGSKGYIGTGINNNYSNQNAFWEYDPVTNGWTQKATFAGIERTYAVGFSIIGKGYIGTGDLKNDFWEFTPDGSSCAVPINLSVTNITSSSAKLKWDAIAGAEGYKVRYKVSGTNEWTLKYSTGKSQNLNNLSPNTNYTWEIKTYCTIAPGSSSDWSAKQKFATGSLRIGDESAQQISFQVYPNPASDKITVSFSSNEEGELQILNLVGQIVFSKEINSMREEIDVSNFPNGIYLITITTGSEEFESNFLKE